MALVKYQQNGHYAALCDFKVSASHLTAMVLAGFEVMCFGVPMGGYLSNPQQWSQDYLETGLALLGFKDIAVLVGTDLPRSRWIFIERLQQIQKVKQGLAEPVEAGKAWPGELPQV